MLGTIPMANQAAEAATTTLARADATVRAWYARQRISSDGLVIENGSGLSRTEMISPQQLGSMLEVAWRSDYAPEFISSLPIVALDGTMRNRLKQSTAAGRARLKTGTLRNVVALAGYVNDANNTPHVVVAMINHSNTPQGGTRILDGLIDWIAQSKPMPAVFAVDLGPQP
jgi:serine-type D-Ala-D-Ala carboxypeptidase/endopeptidase (penicillin-binding protein 4)